jgi:hypothetical protein
MWRSAIDKDLKQIFGVSKVLFATPEPAKEQDVIFCDIEKTLTAIKEGKETARVYGKISIMGLYGKNKSGFLSKRVQLANANLTQKFVFGREESPISMGIYEDKFNIYSVDFMYFYKEQYNKPAGNISISKFFLKLKALKSYKL